MRARILLFAVACALFTNGVSAAEKEVPTFAMVMLAKLSEPTEAQWTQAVHTWVAPKAVVHDFKVEKTVINFSVDGVDVMVALMDAPIPWRDLEGPAATSWLWRDAATEIKKHKAHAIVLVRGGKGTLVERCIFLTKMLAAAGDALDAIGIYWGHGTVLLGRKQFEPVAKEASLDALPILAWVEFRVWRSPDGRANVATTGLDYFSCQEIEVIDSRRESTDILDLVMSIAQMQLGGEAFGDGDTVGPDAQTKIKTHHAPSIWQRKPKVLRIEY